MPRTAVILLVLGIRPTNVRPADNTVYSSWHLTIRVQCLLDEASAPRGEASVRPIVGLADLPNALLCTDACIPHQPFWTSICNLWVTVVDFVVVMSQTVVGPIDKLVTV
jgi:hypothetical protein